MRVHSAENRRRRYGASQMGRREFRQTGGMGEGTQMPVQDQMAGGRDLLTGKKGYMLYAVGI